MYDRNNEFHDISKIMTMKNYVMPYNEPYSEILLPDDIQ
jgi:hypothetical protein